MFYYLSWLLCLCMCVLQSKDIGVQMHEELVKVTNELYTVSRRTSSPALWCQVSLVPFPLAAVSSSLPTSIYGKQKKSKRPVGDCRCALSAATPHRCLGQQVVSLHFWGGGRKNICILPSSCERAARSVWRGERSCLQRSFQRTQQSVLSRCTVLCRNTCALLTTVLTILFIIIK